MDKKKHNKIRKKKQQTKTATGDEHTGGKDPAPGQAPPVCEAWESVLRVNVSVMFEMFELSHDLERPGAQE